MILQLRRWLPHRPLVLVGDGGYAVPVSWHGDGSGLLHCCQSLAQPVTLIARLRRDAALYAPAPPRQTGQNGRPPLKGRRLPALKGLLDLPAVSWTEVSAAWYDGTTRSECRTPTGCRTWAAISAARYGLGGLKLGKSCNRTGVIAVLRRGNMPKMGEM